MLAAGEEPTRSKYELKVEKNLSDDQEENGKKFTEAAEAITKDIRNVSIKVGCPLVAGRAY